MEVIIIISSLVFGAFSAYIASEKNRDPLSWFFLGLFFSLLALIAIGVLPSINIRELNDEHRKCPSCAEEVKIEAKICRFCGTELPILQRMDELNLPENKSRSKTAPEDADSKCPKCDSLIAHYTNQCWQCGVLLGKGRSWKPLPLE